MKQIILTSIHKKMNNNKGDIMKKRKIPLRKCIGCGENKPKKELIRIVKNKDNEVKVDLIGRINGRGSYICNDENCFDLAHKNNKIARSLETNISQEIYEELKTVIKGENSMEV